MASDIVATFLKVDKNRERDNGQQAFSPVTNSHLHALKALFNSLFHEIESIQAETNAAMGINSRIDLTAEVRHFEMGLIRNALTRSNGRQSIAARILGIKVTTLHEKLKRYGLVTSFDEENSDN